jgi:hypothetical protein
LKNDAGGKISGSVSGLPVERVVGGVRHAEQRACGRTRAVGGAALGVEPLDRRDFGKPAVAAARRGLELQERNVLRGCAGRAPNDLGGDDAAVGKLPVRTGIVAADGLAALVKQRRDRFPELLGEPA